MLILLQPQHISSLPCSAVLFSRWRVRFSSATSCPQLAYYANAIASNSVSYIVWSIPSTYNKNTPFTREYVCGGVNMWWSEHSCILNQRWKAYSCIYMYLPTRISPGRYLATHRAASQRKCMSRRGYWRKPLIARLHLSSVFIFHVLVIMNRPSYLVDPLWLLERLCILAALLPKGKHQ